MSHLADAYDELRAKWSGLEQQWTIMRRQWRDGIGDQFEREMWQEWEAEIPKLLQAMTELDEVLDQALRRTSD